MSEILEQITEGKFVQRSNTGTEPVSNTTVKAFLNMGSIAAHDSKIDVAISAAREAIENKYGVALIDKSVKVTFNKMYDWDTLPFYGTVSGLTVTDYDGDTIESANYRIVGDRIYDRTGNGFTEGLIIEYDVTADDEMITESVTYAITRIAAATFEGQMSLRDAVKEYGCGLSLKTTV